MNQLPILPSRPWPKTLKLARKVLKMSLRQVSAETGLSNPYISQLENGHIDDPSFFKMVTLLRAYNLEVDDVL